MELSHAFVRLPAQLGTLWLRADTIVSVETGTGHDGAVLATANGQRHVVDHSPEDVLRLIREATRELRRAEEAGAIGPIWQSRGATKPLPPQYMSAYAEAMEQYQADLETYEQEPPTPWETAP